jgi:DNA helicase-2/ATP-dependent DNA helicase PcrA
MRVTTEDWKEEKGRLELVLKHIENQLNEAVYTNLAHKNEVKKDRKWMWQELTRDVSKFENAIDLVQHGLDIFNKERGYLFSNSLIQKLEKTKKSPYFGRINFSEKESEQTEEIYIGISALSDQGTGELLIYDWRAPISSMFYDYQLGQANYLCPEGRIDGEITLKRQYKIIDGNMKYMFDNSLQIGDDMLQEMLSKHTDDKMKSIVTMIQSEQNQVIRDGKHNVLIVQGSAGSGKTSIALQRVAYLLYKHRETMNSDHIVIFSPNQLFNNYISDVLPELGEENMLQTTFHEFTERALPDFLVAEDKYDQLEYMLSGKYDSEYGSRMKAIQYKASEKFLQYVKDYVSYIEREGMLFEDLLTHQGEMVISKGELTKLFYEDYKNLPMHFRFERILAIIHETIKELKKKQAKKIEEKLLNRPNYIASDKEIKKLSSAIVKKRFKHFMEDMNVWVFSYAYKNYCRLFQEQDIFQHKSWMGQDQEEWESISRQTLVTLERNELMYEDVAPFLFVKLAFEGVPEQSTIRHCIIDEGQDYSMFHFEIMKQLFPRSSFTVLGDLNQSIHDDVHRNHYQMVIERLQADKASIVRLYKSYRSTEEIVNFSKAMLIDGEGVIPIEREGNRPLLLKIQNKEHTLQAVLKSINQWRGQGMNSIAVICKTAEEGSRVYDQLKHELNVYLITKKETQFNKGIVVIPAYLAKGLEFDAVLIWDVGANHYHHERERKLLYTVCTRALHQLHLVSVGKASPFITSIKSDLYDVVIV